MGFFSLRHLQLLSGSFYLENIAFVSEMLIQTRTTTAVYISILRINILTTLRTVKKYNCSFNYILIVTNCPSITKAISKMS